MTTHAGQGDVVIFNNTDFVVHTFTSGTPDGGPDGIFDSGLKLPRYSFQWQADTAGEIPYFCTTHPWMTGLIIVEKQDQPMPETPETPDPETHCTPGYELVGDQCIEEDPPVSERLQKMIEDLLVKIEVLTQRIEAIESGMGPGVDCPTGQVPVGGTCMDIICPVGYELDGNRCDRIRCDSGYDLNHDTNTCEFSGCPYNYTLDGNECVFDPTVHHIKTDRTQYMLGDTIHITGKISPKPPVRYDFDGNAIPVTLNIYVGLPPGGLIHANCTTDWNGDCNNYDFNLEDDGTLSIDLVVDRNTFKTTGEYKINLYMWMQNHDIYKFVGGGRTISLYTESFNILPSATPQSQDYAAPASSENQDYSMPALIYDSTGQ